MPSCIRNSNCALRCSPSMVTANAGSMIERLPLSVLGDLSLNPALVCSRLCRIFSVPHFKSTSHQRNASNSERRAPVERTKATIG